MKRMNVEGIKHVLVIYHGDSCVDGWTSAWVADRFLRRQGDLTYTMHAADYSAAPPLHLLQPDNQTLVLLLDFSYTRRQDMVSLAAAANEVIILDHHQGAIDWLTTEMTAYERDLMRIDISYCTTAKSGALIAWEFFFGSDPVDVPALVKVVSAADLWDFSLPETKAAKAYLAAQPKTLERWLELSVLSARELYEMGQPLIQQIESMLLMSLENIQWARVMTLDKDVGHIVPVVNGHRALASDLGERLNLMYPDTPFSLVYWDLADGTRKYSMRAADTAETGFSCIPIAKMYGGGGHAGAAGFYRSTLSLMRDVERANIRSHLNPDPDRDITLHLVP